MSITNINQIQEGLTYDDVLLVPAYSEVLPRDVQLKSKFTRNILVNTPIVSAAMDTVTDAKLAIAMAQQGGIGVIHKNMTIAEQALEVRKVKRSESGMILDPVTLSEDALVKDALSLMKENVFARSSKSTSLLEIPITSLLNPLSSLTIAEPTKPEPPATKIVMGLA